MAFSINHSAAFDIVPKGEYEFVVSRAALSYTRKGTELIDIRLTIRNDIEQPFRNRVVDAPIFRRRTPLPEDAACDGFSAMGINRISRAVGMENGKTYAGLNQWLADLSGRPLRGTVYHEEYNGSKSARVRNMAPTRFPDVQHKAAGAAGTMAAAPATPGAQADDDCPF